MATKFNIEEVRAKISAGIPLTTEEQAGCDKRREILAKAKELSDQLDAEDTQYTAVNYTVIRGKAYRTTPRRFL